MKVIFNIDRGQFKKGTVIDRPNDLARHLMSTGPEGSVSEAKEDAVVTDRSDILKHIKKLKDKSDEVVIDKAKALDK